MKLTLSQTMWLAAIRVGRAWLIALAATPAAALAGSTLMFALLWLTQESVTLMAAPVFLYLGVVFGSWHAAPVTLGLLPLVASAGLLRLGRTAGWVWVVMAGVAGAFRMHLIDPDDLRAEEGLGGVLVAGGAVGGLVAGAVFLLARAWIMRQPRRAVTSGTSARGRKAGGRRDEPEVGR